jgi:hypothetical protein
MVVRVPHIAALIAFNMAALRGFGVEVPLGTALATMPVVMFIALIGLRVHVFDAHASHIGERLICICESVV